MPGLRAFSCFFDFPSFTKLTFLNSNFIQDFVYLTIQDFFVFAYIKEDLKYTSFNLKLISY